MAYWRGSETTLEKEGEWVSQVGLRERHDTVAGSVFADQEGTIYIEQSADGVNWDISTSYSVTASDGKGFNESLLLPYWRIRYVNGSEDQENFRLSANTQAGGDS